MLCGSAWFQMGSYFGSSLCAVDLNKDGLSDLLVGAPMHSQLRDEGRVTVYLSKGNVSWDLVAWHGYTTMYTAEISSKLAALFLSIHVQFLFGINFSF